MWFYMSLFVFLFHHSWCSWAFWWILTWVSIFMIFCSYLYFWEEFLCKTNQFKFVVRNCMRVDLLWRTRIFSYPRFCCLPSSIRRITKWTLDRKLSFGELHWKMRCVINPAACGEQKDQIKVWALQDNHVLPHGLRSRKKPAKEKPAIKVFIVPFPLQMWCKIYGGLWKYIGLQRSSWTITYWTVWMWVCLDLHRLAKSWYEMRSVQVNACFNDHWFQGYECHYFMPWLFHHL
jgi:hypothetical protein